MPCWVACCPSAWRISSQHFWPIAPEVSKWSPIQYISRPNAAWFQCSRRHSCFQHGMVCIVHVWIAHSRTTTLEFRKLDSVPCLFPVVVRSCHIPQKLPSKNLNLILKAKVLSLVVGHPIRFCDICQTVAATNDSKDTLTRMLHILRWLVDIV